MFYLSKNQNFLYCLLIIIITIFFYMYVVNYLNSFPNNYAWKDLMIKWTDEEIVRRGLLGSVFFAFDSIVSIKYLAPFFVYLSFIISSFVIFNRLRILLLPSWLLVCVLFSPALFLFNLNPTLVVRKDIFVILGCILLLLITKKIWNVESKNFNKRILLYIFICVYLFIYFFLLIFELFAVFVPFIILYCACTISKRYSLKKTILFCAALVLVSICFFVVLVVPNSGDFSTVVKIINDWGKIYPDLIVYENTVDPFAFMAMDSSMYKEFSKIVLSKTNFFQVFMIYVLMILPIIAIYKLRCVRLALPRRIKFLQKKFPKFFILVLFFIIHAPLMLSFVAFDYGRWLIFTFYLMVLFLCFFTEKNDNSLYLTFVNKIYNFKVKKVLFLVLVWILTIIYILTWQPQHWAGSGAMLKFNEYKFLHDCFLFYLGS